MRVFHKNTSPTVSLECLIHTHEPKENKIMSRFNGIIEVRDVFQKDIWVFSCPCTLGPDHTPLPKNKSERPVDALAVKKYHSLTESLSDNLKSRDASASKNITKGTTDQKIGCFHKSNCF